MLADEKIVEMWLSRQLDEGYMLSVDLSEFLGVTTSICPIHMLPCLLTRRPTKIVPSVLTSENISRARAVHTTLNL